jgi:hypothetical protein
MRSRSCAQCCAAQVMPPPRALPRRPLLTVGFAGELPQVQLDLVPAVVQSQGHGADEGLDARDGLRGMVQMKGLTRVMDCGAGAAARASAHEPRARVHMSPAHGPVARPVACTQARQQSDERVPRRAGQRAWALQRPAWKLDARKRLRTPLSSRTCTSRLKYFFRFLTSRTCWQGQAHTPSRWWQRMARQPAACRAADRQLLCCVAAPAPAPRRPPGRAA